MEQILTLLIIAVITQGVLIMASIDNLNTAVANLQATVDAIVIPTPTENNDAAIQAAADNINASVQVLKDKLNPTV